MEADPIALQVTFYLWEPDGCKLRSTRVQIKPNGCTKANSVRRALVYVLRPCVIAQPRFCEDLGRLATHLGQDAWRVLAQRHFALLLSHAVSDEECRLAACKFAKAEARQSSIEPLMIAHSFRDTEHAQCLFGEFDLHSCPHTCAGSVSRLRL
jgi:hypothetical protein